MNEHDLLTPKEVAQRLRLSLSATYALIRDELPHIKLGGGLRGGRILVRLDDLDQWISSKVREPLIAQEVDRCLPSKPVAQASWDLVRALRAPGRRSADRTRDGLRH